MTGRALGGSTIPVFKVEAEGRVLRGVALPFGEGAIVPGPQGSLVEEVMDEKSVTGIVDSLPLLVGHQRDVPPAGLVRHAAVTPKGVWIEGELIGSDDELEGWRRRFREGLSAGLSVGFARDKSRDVYERPRRQGGLPVVRPRDISIVEVSLCQWPAYSGAGVVSLSVRTAAAEHQHEESERIIRQVTMDQALRRGRKILEEKRKKAAS